MIASEPGALHMTFKREPVVAPASPTLTFGSKGIPSASYSETNGAAVVTVNTSIPVMASFSNDGRTITVAGTAPPQSAASGAPPPNTPAAAQAAPTPTTASSMAPATAPRYFAIVDASHGGDDHGETLSASLVEKDVTIALARSLRQELQSRGITTLVLRDAEQISPSTSGQSTLMRTGQPFTLCCMPLRVGAAFTFTPQCSPLAATIMGPSIPGTLPSTTGWRQVKAQPTRLPGNCRSGKSR